MPASVSVPPSPHIPSGCVRADLAVSILAIGSAEAQRLERESLQCGNNRPVGEPSSLRRDDRMPLLGPGTPLDAEQETVRLATGKTPSRRPNHPFDLSSGKGTR